MRVKRERDARSRCGKEMAEKVRKKVRVIESVYENIIKKQSKDSDLADCVSIVGTICGLI